ncbi:MAG: SUMF1/EgtB/PvdO family nonheme iron enzyme [Pontiellaceae bacterium]|nr:SUMF1/EgtB/PvdO family nonheme iron enzyme [Pontiellaceae bacterium]MBN2784815.1 SUMF1/EgtB/PvdO family nonheme iron enzyme [Pontiellaceae bacterium]
MIKNKMVIWTTAVTVLIATFEVQASEIVVSWQSNGVLVAEGMEPGTTGSLKQTSSITNLFADSSSDSVVVDSNGIARFAISMSDPVMFFRVSGTPASSAVQSMVLIPSGTNSGTDPDFGAYSLSVDAFYMDATEVVNDTIVEVMQWAYDNGRILISASTVQNATGDAQELLDLDASGCQIIWNGERFGMNSAKGSRYPCVEISWCGAAAFCNYRSEMEGKTPCYDLSDWSCNLDAGGYRLPTSDEWEYAARGGLSGKRFPWGDTITHSEANYKSSTSYNYDTSATRGYHPDYSDGTYPYTSPVGSFGTNSYGLYDMAGNVMEWCNDKHPDYEEFRVFRGGSWYYTADLALCGNVLMSKPYFTFYHVGFRSVMPAH